MSNILSKKIKRTVVIARIHDFQTDRFKHLHIFNQDAMVSLHQQMIKVKTGEISIGIGHYDEGNWFSKLFRNPTDKYGTWDKPLLRNGYITIDIHVDRNHLTTFGPGEEEVIKSMKFDMLFSGRIIKVGAAIKTPVKFLSIKAYKG